MAAPIRLTAGERSAVEWAFGAMEDYWGAPCKVEGRCTDPACEGVYENELEEQHSAVGGSPTMPWLDGDMLHLSSWDEINHDLWDRLETQLATMTDHGASDQKIAANTRVALSAAAKIKEACK